MSTTLIATIAGLTTALCWGTSDWLTAKSAKKLRPIEVNFAIQVVGTILVAGLFLLSDVHMPNGEQLARIGLASFLITMAYLIFVKALASGVVGIIVPLANSYPLVTIALSIIFLNATLSLGKLGAMVVIVLGAATLAYEKNTKKISIRELHRETMLAAAAMVTWGVAFFFMAPVVSQLSWQTITIIVEIYMLPITCLWLFVTSGRRTFSSMKKALGNVSALAIGVTGTAGGAALYLGSDYANSILIPTVLSAGGPLVASVLGAVFDHEKIGWLKRLGALLIVVGIIALNLFK